MEEGYVIILCSEELEKLQAASMIAAIAAASDEPVEIFVTMGALTAFEKETVEKKTFVGGRVATAMLTSESTKVPLFTDQLMQARELGPLKMYACTMAMDLLDRELDDYVDVFDDVLGVSGFLKKARGKEIIFV